MQSDERLELAGYICNINRRLHLRGGSELEYLPTKLGLLTILRDEPIDWSPRTAPWPHIEGQKFSMTPAQRRELTLLLRKDVRSRLYERADSQLAYFDTWQKLSAIADNRVEAHDGKAVYLRRSKTADGYAQDEFLFQNPALADVFPLPVTTIVGDNSIADRVLRANDIDTLGELMQLRESELKSLYYKSGDLTLPTGRALGRYAPIPPDQVAALLCELDRRGWHLTRLDKSQPPPGGNDWWVYLSRDAYTFPVVLESQVRSTDINPIPIEWLLGKYDQRPARILHSLEIHTIGQLLRYTEESLWELLMSRFKTKVERPKAKDLQGQINYHLDVTGLRLATEPTPVI